MHSRSTSRVKQAHRGSPCHSRGHTQTNHLISRPPVSGGVGRTLKGHRAVVQGPRDALCGDFPFSSMEDDAVSLERARGSRVTKGGALGRDWPLLAPSQSHTDRGLECVTVPINADIQEHHSFTEIRNFLGEKCIIRVRMR